MTHESAAALNRIVETLDPLLTPIGFAPGQIGGSPNAGQVIYCRPHSAQDERCVDVVLDVRKSADWQIVRADIDDGPDNEVRHLRLTRDIGLAGQLDQLAQTLVSDVRT